MSFSLVASAASTTIVLVLASFVLWIRYRQDYFKRHDVPFWESFLLVGLFADVLMSKVGMYDKVEEIYTRSELRDEQFYGIHSFHKPAIMITDPQLIKRVLVEDFSSFSNHHAASDEHDPLGDFNLFAVKTATWTLLRGKLSPFFSSS